MPNDNGSGDADNGSAPKVKLDGPRLYLNGFPKSGLHLLWAWSLPFVAEPAFTPKPWAASFMGNCWTTTWVDDDRLFPRLDALRPGTYLKAHTGYRPDIEEYLRTHGIVHIFVYRDLRDVAVSQAHHILSANEKHGDHGHILYHPGADAIKEMARGDFDYVLAAVIAGYGPWNGLIERWELFAPWLDVGWVLSLKYEDMRHKAFETAQLMIRYVYGRTARVAGFKMGLYQNDLEAAAKHLLNVADQSRQYSPTFRKGQTGGWREAFNEDHIELWREHDPTDWITKLGYSWETETTAEPELMSAIASS